MLANLQTKNNPPVIPTIREIVVMLLALFHTDLR
jgi:hypothetical protein